MTNGRSGMGTVGARRRSASGWLSLVMAVVATTVGPVAVFGQAGPSVLKLGGTTSTGLAVLGGLGSVF